MGDVNQLIFLKQHIQKVDGSILEIGSKDYGSTSSFRDYLPNNPYVGLDMPRPTVKSSLVTSGIMWRSGWAFAKCRWSSPGRWIWKNARA